MLRGIAALISATLIAQALATCSHPELIGDGTCSDAENNAACLYGAGDCTSKTSDQTTCTEGTYSSWTRCCNDPSFAYLADKARIDTIELTATAALSASVNAQAAADAAQSTADEIGESVAGLAPRSELRWHVDSLNESIGLIAMAQSAVESAADDANATAHEAKDLALQAIDDAASLASNISATHNVSLHAIGTADDAVRTAEAATAAVAGLGELISSVASNTTTLQLNVASISTNLETTLTAIDIIEHSISDIEANARWSSTNLSEAVILVSFAVGNATAALTASNDLAGAVEEASQEASDASTAVASLSTGFDEIDTTVRSHGVRLTELESGSDTLTTEVNLARTEAALAHAATSTLQQSIDDIETSVTSATASMATAISTANSASTTATTASTTATTALNRANSASSAASTSNTKVQQLTVVVEELAEGLTGIHSTIENLNETSAELIGQLSFNSESDTVVNGSLSELRRTVELNKNETERNHREISVIAEGLADFAGITYVNSEEGTYDAVLAAMGALSDQVDSINEAVASGESLEAQDVKLLDYIIALNETINKYNIFDRRNLGSPASFVATSCFDTHGARATCMLSAGNIHTDCKYCDTRLGCEFTPICGSSSVTVKQTIATLDGSRIESFSKGYETTENFDLATHASGSCSSASNASANCAEKCNIDKVCSGDSIWCAFSNCSVGYQGCNCRGTYLREYLLYQGEKYYSGYEITTGDVYTEYTESDRSTFRDLEVASPDATLELRDDTLYASWECNSSSSITFEGGARAYYADAGVKTDNRTFIKYKVNEVDVGRGKVVMEASCGAAEVTRKLVEIPSDMVSQASSLVAGLLDVETNLGISNTTPAYSGTVLTINRVAYACSILLILFAVKYAYDYIRMLCATPIVIFWTIWGCCKYGASFFGWIFCARARRYLAFKLRMLKFASRAGVCEWSPGMVCPSCFKVELQKCNCMGQQHWKMPVFHYMIATEETQALWPSFSPSAVAGKCHVTANYKVDPETGEATGKSGAKLPKGNWKQANPQGSTMIFFVMLLYYCIPHVFCMPATAQVRGMHLQSFSHQYQDPFYTDCAEYFQELSQQDEGMQTDLALAFTMGLYDPGTISCMMRFESADMITEEEFPSCPGSMTFITLLMMAGARALVEISPGGNFATPERSLAYLIPVMLAIMFFMEHTSGYEIKNALIETRIEPPQTTDYFSAVDQEPCDRELSSAPMLGLGILKVLPIVYALRKRPILMLGLLCFMQAAGVLSQTLTGSYSYSDGTATVSGISGQITAMPRSSTTVRIGTDDGALTARLNVTDVYATSTLETQYFTGAYTYMQTNTYSCYGENERCTGTDMMGNPNHYTRCTVLAGEKNPIGLFTNATSMGSTTRDAVCIDAPWRNECWLHETACWFVWQDFEVDGETHEVMQAGTCSLAFVYSFELIDPKGNVLAVEYGDSGSPVQAGNATLTAVGSYVYNEPSYQKYFICSASGVCHYGPAAAANAVASQAGKVGDVQASTAAGLTSDRVYDTAIFTNPSPQAGGTSLVWTYVVPGITYMLNNTGDYGTKTFATLPADLGYGVATVTPQGVKTSITTSPSMVFNLVYVGAVSYTSVVAVPEPAACKTPGAVPDYAKDSNSYVATGQQQSFSVSVCFRDSSSTGGYATMTVCDGDWSNMSQTGVYPSNAFDGAMCGNQSSFMSLSNGITFTPGGTDQYFETGFSMHNNNTIVIATLFLCRSNEYTGTGSQCSRVLVTGNITKPLDVYEKLTYQNSTGSTEGSALSIALGVSEAAVPGTIAGIVIAVAAVVGAVVVIVVLVKTRSPTTYAPAWMKSLMKGTKQI